MTIRKTIQSWLAKSLGMGAMARLWDSGADIGGLGGEQSADRPYAQVSLVYKCISSLISGVAGLPPVLSTLDERIVESGPVWDLLFARPDLPWERFVADSVGHYALDGECFWLFDDQLGTRPMALRVVSGRLMRHITADGRPDGPVIAWEYQYAGVPVRYAPDQVHQWRNYNPYNLHRGLGAVAAAANDINYSFNAALYNASALANGAEPGAILTIPGRADDDTRRALRENFDA
ncbi:MAG: phage portal protein, partial [Candidatus Krumholzibacteria bacterium]|nr:phage portal protein [Candidatus Krumholzibacteria bacterium]